MAAWQRRRNAQLNPGPAPVGSLPALSADLPMDVWQRVRARQVAGEADFGGADGEALSDDLPMDVWQRVRARQVAGDVISGGAGDDALAGGPREDVVGGAPKAGAFNVDRQFLAEREGFERAMYVPKDKKTKQVLDKSGPTIGIGVDLGGKDVAYLKSLGLDANLVTRLTPYLGKRGASALDFVEKNPLALSDPELNALNSAVQDQELNRLVAKYDAASKIGPFRSLPKNTQTAIASLYFQHGTYAPEQAAPNYWRQITSGDWKGAHSNLQNFGDHYGPRRLLEAKLLQKDIEAGRLRR
ncbi:MAG: pesticin C-terminus-like muramidase [Phenylobacterium sp.]